MKILTTLVLMFLAINSIQSQAIYTVSKTTDFNPFAYYNNPDDPNIQGTLQWAFRKVNENPNPCIINFNITGSGQQVINLEHELPVLNNQVFINGTSQFGYQFNNPLIVINGQSIIGTALQINNQNNCKIKGLCIQNCAFQAIVLFQNTNTEITENVINNIQNNVTTVAVGIRVMNSSNIVIKGNIIGTDVTEASGLGNKSNGIMIEYSSSNTIIGGIGNGEGNTIAFNGSFGILITSGSEHIISGNRIFNNPIAIKLGQGVNINKQPPAITSYSAETITGTSQPNDIIEIFGSTGSENANEYLTSTTADGSGSWTSTVVSNSWNYAIATATDGSNNTSILSNSFEKPQTMGSSQTNALLITPTQDFSYAAYNMEANQTEFWFKFVAVNNNYIISVNPQSQTPQANIEEIFLYSNENNILLNIGNSNFNDSLYILSNDLIDGNIYFIKVKRQLSNNNNFNIVVQLDNNTKGFSDESSCMPTCDNYVSNGDFEVLDPDGTIDGTYSFYNDENGTSVMATDVCGWYSAWGTPQLTPINVSSQNHFAQMWYGPNEYPYSGFSGEGLYTWLTMPLLTNAQYRLSFRYKNSDDICTNWQVRLTSQGFAPTGSHGEPIPGFNSVNSQLITSQSNSNNWTTVTILFIPNSNWDKLCIYPSASLNNLQTWLYIDDISITKLGICDENNQTICAGASTTLTATGGVSYIWSTGESSQSISVNPQTTTTYTVTVTDLWDNEYTDNVTVNVNQIPVMTSATTATICSGATVNIPLTSNITSTYTWVAQNNTNTTGESTTTQTTSTLSNTITNNTTSNQTVTYTVIPTSVTGGCVGTPQTVNVTVKPKPSMTSATSASICSGGTVSIPLTSNIASTYTWLAANNANTNGESTTTQTTSTLSNTITNNSTSAQTVTYTVTPTSTTGSCVGTPQIVNVTVKPVLVMTSATSATICSGSTVSIPLTSNIASTYSWIATNNANTTGESTTAQSGSPLSNTITNTTTSAQTVTYTVTPTSTNGSCAGTPQTVSVVVNPLPTAAIYPATSTICYGATATLTASGGGTYLWSNSASATTASITVNPASTTTYTVTVTSAAGCKATASRTVTVNDLPTASITPITSTICEGTNTTLTASGDGTYAWSNGAITAAITVSPSTTTIYTVTVTNTAGCTFTPNSIVIVNPKPSMTSATSATICSGGTVNIPLTSNVASTYTWIAANNANTTGESTTLQTSNTINNTITNSSTSAQIVTYTVTPTSTTGSCAGTPQIVNVTLNLKPSMTSATTATICSGNTVSIPLTSNIASTYSWIATNNANTTGESTTAQYGSPLSNTITNNTLSSQTVTYTVTPTSTSGSCAGTPQTVIVSVNASPIIGGQISICVGSTGQLSATPTPASVNPWISSNTEIATISNNGLVTGVSAGTTTITYTNSNGCQKTITVTVKALPTISGTLSACVGSTSTLTGSPTPSSYNPWISSNTAVATISNSGVVTGVSAGNTTIKYTNSNGCQTTTTLTVNTAPVMTNPTTATICSGGTVSIPLTSNEVSTFSWVAANNPTTSGESTTIQNNSLLSNTITNYSSSTQVTYTVTATNSFGCTATNNVVVTVNPNITPLATFTFDNLDNCITQNVLFSVTAAYNPNYTYQWDFDNDGVYDLSSYYGQHQYYFPGFYQVTLKVSTGCATAYSSQIVSIVNTSSTYNTSCCSDNHTYVNPYSNNTDYIEITGADVVWNEDLYEIKGTLVIKPNAKLTLSDGTNMTKVQFGPNGKIIVERRGTLVIERGCKISGLDECGNMWQGIEVWGNASRDHSLANQPTHGKLITTFSPININDAHQAILVGRSKICYYNPNTQTSCTNSPFNTYYGGGIIDVNGCVFENNGNSIKFTPYNFDNISDVSSSTFKCVGTLKDPGYKKYNWYEYPNSVNPLYEKANTLQRSPMASYLWKVNGVNYSSNKFYNTEKAVTSVDAVYAVNNSTFTNHLTGVYIQNTSNAYGSEFTGNTFTDIKSYGIYIEGGFQDKITNSNVFRNNTTSQSSYLYGIYLKNSYGFEILDNTFQTLSNGISCLNTSTNGGTIGYNTVGNTFTDCKKAVVTSGINPNLTIRCNNFTPSTTTGLYTSNWYLLSASSSTPANQGILNLPPNNDHHEPAGNEFMTTSKNQLYSSKPFMYVRHNDASTTPINYSGTNVNIQNNLTDKVYTFPGSCDPVSKSNYIAPLTSLQQQILMAEYEYNNIMSTIDGGKTNQLLNAINGNTSAGNVKNMLTANSPLSDDVIISYISSNKSNTPGLFKEVMTPNLPVTDSVYEYYYSDKLLSMPQGIRNQLEKLQGINSGYRTPAAVLRDIKDADNHYTQLLIEAIQHWTENDSAAYAMQYLESINKPETNKILANYYLSTGDLANASQKFNSLPINSQDDADYLNLNNMLINLASDSLTPFDMDSAQIAYIRNLAYSSSQSQAANNARAILWLVFGEEFEDVIDTNIVTNKSGLIFNNETNQPESIIPDNDEIFINHLPNPVNNKVIFRYNLPKSSDNASVVIYDIAGKKIKTIFLQLETTQSEADLSDLPTGVYHYSLIVNNQLILNQKLIKTND